jgi:peptidoglycan/LPS O-acetylase OafA/YrhL
MQQRLSYLDGARGILAFMVVVFHCLGGYADHRLMGKLEQEIVWTFINGNDAVSFFFVLSGFVLSYRYFVDGSIPNYPKYIISRLFRLYPAFWFVLIVFSIYAHRGFRGFSEDTANFIKEASMYQKFDAMLGQAWSLNIELAISLMLPILIVAAQREIRYMYFLLPLTLVFHGFIDGFFFNFVLGIIVAYWLAREPEQLKHVYQVLKKYAFASIPLLWVGFSLRHIWRAIFPNPIDGFDWVKNYAGIDFHSVAAVSCFFMLIAILESGRIQALLNKPVFDFLGKISYSLYICHWFFLFGCIYTLHDTFQNYFQWDNRCSVALVSLIVIVVSLLFATFMYYYIEKPFIKMGKKVAARFGND